MNKTVDIPTGQLPCLCREHPKRRRRLGGPNERALLASQMNPDGHQEGEAEPLSVMGKMGDWVFRDNNDHVLQLGTCT